MGSWQINQVGNLPTVSERMGGCIVDDYIYVFGGYDENEVKTCYKLHKETFIKTDLQSFTAQQIARYKAVYDVVTHKIHIICRAYINFSYGLYYYRFDVASDTFDITEHFLSVTYGNSLSTLHLINSKIYVGVEDNTSRIYEFDTLTYAYNQRLNYGTNILNEGISFACMNRMIFVTSSSTFEYNTITNNMTLLCASAYANMRYGASWTIGSKGYVYASTNDGTNPSGLYVFDFNTNTWSGPTQSARYLVQPLAVVDKGSTYILGGNTGTAPSANIYKYSYYLDPPTAFTSQIISGDIKLDWVDASNEETEYQVSRMADNEVIFSVVGTIPVQVGSNYTFTDTNVYLDNRSYQYQIKARLLIS